MDVDHILFFDYIILLHVPCNEGYISKGQKSKRKRGGRTRSGRRTSVETDRVFDAIVSDFCTPVRKHLLNDQHNKLPCRVPGLHRTDLS